jgi:hypothetical protein
VETNDLFHRPRLRTHGLHSSILRLLLPVARQFLVTAGPEHSPRREMLHFGSKPKATVELLERGTSMAAGDEAAAAILVQTIFLKDGHLQGLLGEQANKSPVAAAEFLKPFYRAVLAMVVKTRADAAA